ncbi:SPFH domain-containing protein [Marinifilum flexuosum]|uniref:Regulator of protease activity HflC (Stomatin/prohibitin superfamily) n=1 Tax=Marinifilum flexuosum TaxID=1117708 RepID=A0A419X343_9BACT|nr:SPFH domain-containing protein [Marinifilum flexuosum]RKE02039.1 regulator of protease activity HflC (stomatin/prohibitin superfamily) [Marinifilum flexuosum]
MENLAIIIFSVLAVILLLFSIVIVNQKQAKIIQRLGKFQSVRKAGISLRIPIIDQVVGVQNLQIQELRVPVETITQDKVTLKIEVAIQYLIKADMESIKNSFYELADSTAQIESFVFDAVRAEVPKMELDMVYENKDNIANTVMEGLNSLLSSYGFDIKKTLVVDILPDAKVVDAMNAINEQKRLRQAAEEKGEAEKILIIKAAEAEKESKKLQGEGVALQQMAVLKGREKAIKDLTVGTNMEIKDATELVIKLIDQETLISMGEKNKNVIFMTSDLGMKGKMMEAMVGADVVSNQHKN